MEKVYSLENPRDAGRVNYEYVLERFFPERGSTVYELFRQRIANGLKHDSFIRNELLEFTYPGSDKYADSPLGIVEISVPGVEALTEDQKLTFLKINKVSFWKELCPQMDKFYGGLPIMTCDDPDAKGGDLEGVLKET